MGGWDKLDLGGVNRGELGRGCGEGCILFGRQRRKNIIILRIRQDIEKR